MRASDGTRRGYVDEYAAPKQIFFHRWSGDVTGELATQNVTMSANDVAVAEWYVGAACVRVVVRTNPSTAGDVVTGGIGNECPVFKSMYANVAACPRSGSGTDLTFAARPKGSLQTIWRVEGTSVSNTEACRVARRSSPPVRDAPPRPDAGLRRPEPQEQGYLPGLTIARIQEEAQAMYAKGYSQDDIVHDLKLMGLLDDTAPRCPTASGRTRATAPERHVVPAGQRIISMKADGNIVLTAYFCQAVDPSVTVIDLDGSAPRDRCGARRLRAGVPEQQHGGQLPDGGLVPPRHDRVLGSAGTGVPGYAIDGWTLDGVAKPAGPLSVPITQDGAAHKVGLTVKVQCHKLTVAAEFGHTAYPLPNCPGSGLAEPVRQGHQRHRHRRRELRPRVPRAGRRRGTRSTRPSPRWTRTSR